MKPTRRHRGPFDQLRMLADYIAKNGPIPVSCNAGTRRTESKQALLAPVNAITDKQG